MKKYLVILAAAIMGWSCEGFDDADLKSRLDDVEDRVDSVEQELAQLREMVKSINDSYGALVGVMNGGLITKIEVTADGYDITVRWNENGEIRDEVYSVKSGAKGDPGTAPELTLEKDEESGRYYWLIDGEEPEGGRVWATGEKGDKGDAGETGGTGAAGGKGDKGDAGQNGKTPTLAVNTGNTYPGDVSTGDKYWWVSYDDGANLTNPSQFSWQRLTVYDGTSSGGGGVVTVQYDSATGKVTFYQNGVAITDAVVQAYNGLDVSFGDDIEAYGTLRFYNSEAKEITVTITGGSDHAVVKAELQNNDGSYNVAVDDSNNITVTAQQPNAANKLLVEVLDNKNCIHKWINLKTNVPGAYLAFPDADDNGYMPVAFGNNMDAAMNNVPFKPAIYVVLDVPAIEDITFNVSLSDDTINGGQLKSNTVTIRQGQTQAAIDYSVDDRSNLVCDSYTCFNVTNTDNKAHVVYGSDYLSIANNFDYQLELTADSYHSYFGGATGNWCDGDYGTSGETNYGESNFKQGAAFGTYLDTIATWGIYVDIDLPESIYGVVFAYCHRSGRDGAPGAQNGEIGALKFGAYSGNDYVEIGNATQASDNLPTAAGRASLTQSQSGYWKSKCYVLNNGASFDKVRFGATKAYSASLASSAGEDGFVDATTMPWVSFCINELEVHYMY